MTADGVIPPDDVRWGRVQLIATVQDKDGIDINVCVERDFVRLEVGSSIVLLNAVQAEQFVRLFVAACWTAGRNLQRLAAAMPP